jgi:hypothetical protein
MLARVRGAGPRRAGTLARTPVRRDREDWDLAAAYEAMARALAVSADLRGAAEWKAKAEAALGAIAEDEDREQIGQDIATLPV